MATAPPSIYNGSDNLDLTCDVCQHQNKTTIAVSYCEHCQETLCKQCDSVHRSQKFTRNHKLMTGNDQMLFISLGRWFPPSEDSCEKSNMIKFLGEAEDTVCSDTFKKTSHGNYDLILLNDLIQDNKHMSVFEEAKKRLETFEQSFHELKGEKTSDRSTLKANINTCIDEVKRIRQYFNDLLDNLERDMVKELTETEELLSKDLVNQMGIADGAIKQIQRNVKILKQCQQQGNPQAMLICAKEVESEMMTFQKRLDTLRQESVAVNQKFIPDDILINALNELKSFGNISTNCNGNAIVPTMLGLSVSDIMRHHVDCARVQSVVFFPSGHTILACHEQGLRLLNKLFKEISKLSIRAVSACKISDTEVIISKGIEKEIQFVSVLPKMVAKNTLSIGKRVLGCCYHSEEIYVICNDKDSSNGEIRVLDENGELKRIFCAPGGKHMFSRPWDVKVNDAGDKVFVTDRGTNTVTCFDQSGRVIYKYFDKDLLDPLGMLVDDQDNILVCGKMSCNVHAISKTGKKENVYFQKKEGISDHICISYSQFHNCIAVGVFSKYYKSLITLKC